jgi:hypothetical protein
MRLSHAIKAGRALTLVAATASMMAVLGALPASAAPPSHDVIAGAKTITVPFSETVDTREATTDEQDAAINSNCGAPATNGSVWYQLTATAQAYLADVSQSDFTAGVIIATGTPGDLTLVDCGPSSLGFETTPGTTYYLLAFSDNPDVVGGQLAISVSPSAPRPKVSMTVNEKGKANRRTGVATVSGTYTCIGEADFVAIQGRLSQKQGDIHVEGFFQQEGLKCGGTFKWTADVTPESGKFKTGLAAQLSAMAGCNVIGCNFYDALDVVRLK